MESGLLAAFLESGIIGQMVIFILLALSVYACAVIYEKRHQLVLSRTNNKKLLQQYHDAPPQERFAIAADTAVPPCSPMLAVYQTGCRELSAMLAGGNDRGTLNQFQLNLIESALSRIMAHQRLLFEKSLVILATTVTISPFLGLFGTVSGLLVSFRSMGIQGSASIATVAPGISEALITTIAGLFVAIYAVIAYNYLKNNIKVILTETENFACTFLEDIGKRFVKQEADVTLCKS